MKTKRITLLVSIIAIILLFVVLSSTVFSLNRVEFCFLKNPIHYNSNISQDVVECGEFNYGSSVFLVNKKSHIAKIEKQYPYIKVVGIETIFPNTLLIQSVEREEFYAVVSKDEQQMAICDGDFKILRIIEYAVMPNYVIIDNTYANFTNQNAGDFLAINNDLFTQMPKIFERMGYTSSQVMHFLRKVEINSNGNLRLISYNNYYIEIAQPSKFLAEKIALGYKAIFDGEGEDLNGYVYVFQQDNTLKANVIKNQ